MAAHRHKEFEATERQATACLAEAVARQQLELEAESRGISAHRGPCECCEIENRVSRQLHVTMKCQQSAFVKQIGELREKTRRSPSRKLMQEDTVATSERPPRASRMIRRSARGGETKAARPQSGRQTARQSSEAQRTLSMRSRWPRCSGLMSHLAAWAMGRRAAAVISSKKSSETTSESKLQSSDELQSSDSAHRALRGRAALRKTSPQPRWL